MWERWKEQNHQEFAFIINFVLILVGYLIYSQYTYDNVDKSCSITLSERSQVQNDDILNYFIEF